MMLEVFRRNGQRKSHESSRESLIIQSLSIFREYLLSSKLTDDELDVTVYFFQKFSVADVDAKKQLACEFYKRVSETVGRTGADLQNEAGEIITSIEKQFAPVENRGPDWVYKSTSDFFKDAIGRELLSLATEKYPRLDIV
jgi:hypothetical protein